MRQQPAERPVGQTRRWTAAAVIVMLVAMFGVAAPMTVLAARTTAYLHVDHTSGTYRLSTSRAGGAVFTGPGCGTSDTVTSSDAALAWKEGGCSGPVASAVWKPNQATTGWDELSIQTSARFDDRTQAFAAGYLEGQLTHARIYAMVETSIRRKPIDPRFIDFLKRQDAWLRAQVKEQAPSVFRYGDAKLQGEAPANVDDAEHAFWFNVALTLQQLDGLLAGYNARASAERQISLLDLWQLNDDGDKMDIDRSVAAASATAALSNAVASKSASSRFQQKAHDDDDGVTRRVSEMSQEEILELVAFTGHCSAIVKLTDSDVLVGHNSWSDFDLMSRMIKSYDWNLHHTSVRSQAVSFTSYPGYLWSSDDYQVTGRGSSIVSTETTLTILDESLYSQFVGPEKGVMSWLRSIAANRMSATAKEWVENFVRHNSGTYNDAWLVVDYNLVEEAKKARSTSSSSSSPSPLQLLNSTFFLLEQIPGYTESVDLTSLLNEKSYFAGYNLPYLDETNRRSGYARVSAELSTPNLQYATALRGKIFEKEQGKVTSVAALETLMQLNDYQTPGSLTGGCPAAAIAARYDLSPLPGAVCEIKTRRLNGAVDGKVTSGEMVKRRAMRLINGPTHSNGVPAFDWRTSNFASEVKQRMKIPGTPDRYAFEWTTFHPTRIPSLGEGKKREETITIPAAAVAVQPTAAASAAPVRTPAVIIGKKKQHRRQRRSASAPVIVPNGSLQPVAPRAAAPAPVIFTYDTPSTDFGQMRPMSERTLPPKGYVRPAPAPQQVVVVVPAPAPVAPKSRRRPTKRHSLSLALKSLDAIAAESQPDDPAVSLAVRELQAIEELSRKQTPEVELAVRELEAVVEASKQK